MSTTFSDQKQTKALFINQVPKCSSSLSHNFNIARLSYGDGFEFSNIPPESRDVATYTMYNVRQMIMAHPDIASRNNCISGSERMKTVYSQTFEATQLSFNGSGQHISASGNVYSHDASGAAHRVSVEEEASSYARQ